MPGGFFDVAAFQDTKLRVPALPQCGKCGLYRSCISPKMPVYGKGSKGILIVGEAPGTTEDSQGIPFVGKSGQLLASTLDSLSIDMDEDCWRTNSIICHPEGNKIKDKRVVDYCRPNLLKAVKQLQPTVIILTGKTPVQSLIGWLWGGDIGGIGRWIGWQIPCQRLNAWIAPTWHPSYILRQGKFRDGATAAMLWKQHLSAAVKKAKRRPWKELPNYDSRVKVVLDTDRVPALLEALVANDDTEIAFDFESSTLKPDGNGELICCAMSNGLQSIAYPWHGAAIEATKAILISSIPKIGQNCKHEERWTLKHFGCVVNNWVWDDMQGMHVLDNRGGICSLEFQEFVLLGAENHKSGIAPYLKSKDSYTPNRIKEVPLERLLRYCGYDALLEWEIAQVQRKRLAKLVAANSDNKA